MNDATRQQPALLPVALPRSPTSACRAHPPRYGALPLVQTFPTKTSPGVRSGCRLAGRTRGSLTSRSCGERVVAPFPDAHSIDSPEPFLVWCSGSLFPRSVDMLAPTLRRLPCCPKGGSSEYFDTLALVPALK